MLTIIETALKLRRSRSKVYDLIKQGKLGHYRLDGAIFVTEADIETYLASCRVEPKRYANPPSQRTVLKQLTLE